MKKLLIPCVLLILLISSQVIGEVRATPYLADGSTPLELADTGDPNQYRGIMVGTRLTFVIESNVAESEWYGRLLIEDDHRYYGHLFDRVDSIYAAAGDAYMDWCAELWEGKNIEGFKLYTYYGSTEGRWFIIDYEAVEIGDCNVALYWVQPPPFEAYGLIRHLKFRHVPTRDFDQTGTVDLRDFSILASHWGANCQEPYWCQGADLDENSIVNEDDLLLFCEFWLEKAF